MNYPVSLIEWESRFFGFPIGAVDLPSDFSESHFEESIRAAQKRFRLIYVTLNKEGPDELTTPEALCRCYDRRVILKKPVPSNVPHLDPHVRSYTSTFCSRDLERLAIQSGGLTRFRRDPELSMQFERLFLTWINYAVSADMADSIWTWQEGREHVGLVTIRCAKRTNPKTGSLEREGWIGMLAVDEKYRRRGIGMQLFEACDFWCSSLDIPVSSVVTQRENEPTLALCEKIGYKPTSQESIYHYWSPGWVYDAHRGWICRKQ